VSWTAPASNGGSAITSYTATATPSAGSGYASAPTRTCSSATSPCTITGLTNGLTYSVTVTATNAVGTGSASTAATVIPYPSSVMSSSATKLWLDGADSSTMYAGSTCSGTAATTTVGCWADKSTSGNDGSQGTSGNRPTLTTVNGYGVPGFDGTNDNLSISASLLPTGTTASTQFAVAQLTDPAPSSSGYRDVLAWGANGPGDARKVQKTTSGSAMRLDTISSGPALDYGTWTASTTLLQASEFSAGTTLTAWPNGEVTGSSATGTFSTHTNTGAVGKGIGSSEYWYGPVTEIVVLTGTLTSTDRRTVEEYLARKWGNAITPPAPTIGTVTGGDTTAGVTWTAPSWNGGASVSSYTIVATPVDGSLSTVTKTGCTSSPCTVTGLTNGATYAFTVAAVNSVGTGPASSSSTASPYPTTLFGSAQLKVWLDAQYDPALSAATDCSGSSASTGTGIGCWKDRSGNGWNAPRFGSTSAVLTASAINSRPALRFVKTNPDSYQVSGSGIGAVGSADRSVLAVVTARTSYGTTSTNYAGVVAAWSVWYGGILAKANSGSSTTVDYYQSDAYNSSTTGLYTGTAGSTSATLTSAVYSSSGGTLTNQLALGGKGTPASNSLAGSWYSYSDDLRIGSMGTVASANYTYPLDGDIGEILVFNKALTPAERRTAEEYLARHWGLTIAPAAPTLSTVTKPSSGQLTATWSAPSWNGGASVTSYTATATASGQTTRTCSTASTSCTITSLTAGVTYAVTVTATNSVGAGPSSNSVNGTA
jgi:hypothetical protein